jgi:hypothetical protein
MKKEKLLVKEINVLSEVIGRKVNDERKRLLDERVNGDKEYVSLMKKIDLYNKEIKKMKKLEDDFCESIRKIEKRLRLGNNYEDKSRIGYLSIVNVIGNYNKEFGVGIGLNSLYGNDVYNRLMIENIDGDLNVNDLVNRLVKEFVGK